MPRVAVCGDGSILRKERCCFGSMGEKMLFDILRMGSMDSAERIQLLMNICARVFVIFCVLPIHEYAHALTAHKLGDDTARLKGRMTIAPMAHIDPIGALMIFLLGFGYAKPVPVNMRNFRRKRKDSDASNVYFMGSATAYDSGYAKRCMALVALAGPASNLIMAIISLLFKNIINYLIPISTFSSILYYFFYYCAMVNVALALFNFLPIPPLDGSRILNVILPDQIYYKLMQYERYIMIGLFVLIFFTHVLDGPLAFLNSAVIGGLDKLVSLPFRLIKGM